MDERRLPGRVPGPDRAPAARLDSIGCSTSRTSSRRGRPEDDADQNIRLPWPRVNVMLEPIGSRPFSTREMAFESGPWRPLALAAAKAVTISLRARLMRSTDTG